MPAILSRDTMARRQSLALSGAESRRALTDRRCHAQASLAAVRRAGLSIESSSAVKVAVARENFFSSSIYLTMLREGRGREGLRTDAWDSCPLPEQCTSIDRVIDAEVGST